MPLTAAAAGAAAPSDAAVPSPPYATPTTTPPAPAAAPTVPPTAATTVAATVTPSVPPSVPPSVAPVAGVELVDDWGMLTVTVPTTWSFTDTTPWVEEHDTSGGPTSPRIIAATAADHAANWATSSVVFSAYRHITDLNGAIVGGAVQCAPGAIVDYDDGYFVGLRQDFTGCGGTSHTVNIAANPPDGSFTAWLTIVVTPEHEGAIDMILDSFNSLVAQPTYTLTDATGLLTLDVPTSWQEWDVETSPAANGSTPYPTIWASIPGDGPSDSSVWYQAFTATTDFQALLTANDQAPRCTDGAVTDYDDGYFVGVMRTWTDCDGTAGSTVTQVYANPPDRAFTAALAIAFGAPPPDGTLETFLDTFFVVQPAST